MELNSVQKKEYEWFLDNYDMLFSKYGESYLVIKDNTVLGNYKTFSDGLSSVRGKEPDGTYIVHKCGKTKDADMVTLFSHNVI